MVAALLAIHSYLSFLGCLWCGSAILITPAISTGRNIHCQVLPIMTMFYCNAPPDLVEKIIGDNMHRLGVVESSDISRYAGNIYAYANDALRIYIGDSRYVLSNKEFELDDLECKIAIEFERFSTEKRNHPGVLLQLEVMRERMESAEEQGSERQQHLGVASIGGNLLAWKGDVVEAQVMLGIGTSKGRRVCTFLVVSDYRSYAITKELLKKYELLEIAATENMDLERSMIEVLIAHHKI